MVEWRSCNGRVDASPRDSEKENVMLKMMTASIAFAALLVGAASTALAARTHTQNDPVEHQENMLVRDSVAVGFGSEATGRTRISGAIPTTSGY